MLYYVLKNEHQKGKIDRVFIVAMVATAVPSGHCANVKVYRLTLIHYKD